MGTTHTSGITARECGLKACYSCSNLQPIADSSRCHQCGAKFDSRRKHSLQRVWAFLFVGILAYIPANIYPIMQTNSLTGSSADTIVSGVIELIHYNSYLVALIVFFASVCIPLAKFLIIAVLAMSVQFKLKMSQHTRHRLFLITECIGRWSMIDVFVVAVLAALIQLRSLITVLPGTGINAFCLSVIFTMFAASSLDPRLIWDNLENE